MTDDERARGIHLPRARSRTCRPAETSYQTRYFNDKPDDVILRPATA